MAGSPRIDRPSPHAALSPSEQETASIVAALKSCGRSRDLDGGRAIHARLLRRHSSSKATLILANSLIDMYSRCGSMAEAHHVFASIQDRCSVVSWNSLITGYARNGHGDVTLEIFSEMPVINARSCVSVLEAIKNLAAREEAHRVKAEIHGPEILVRIVSLERTLAFHSKLDDAGSVEASVFVANSLIDCYAKCGSMSDSQRVFDRLLASGLDDAVSWNSIILGYVNNGHPELALELFDRMTSSSIVPNARTFVAAINACSSIAAKTTNDRELRSRCLERATAIQSRITASLEISSDRFVQNSLLDLHVKAGDPGSAWMIFEKMESLTLVSWNVIILGFAKTLPKFAIELLDGMRHQGFVPDDGTVIAVLKACAASGFLEPGKSIAHSLACRVGVEADSAVSCSLIGHYGRCDCPVAAELAFLASSSPDSAAWSALIASHSAGDNEQAFQFFHQMIHESIRPDEITLLSLLSACSRLGLVDRAKKLFREMTIKHRLIPNIDHYTCIVDLLGRANQLEDAMELIETIPAPSVSIWMTLLSACHNWKNVAIGRRSFDAIEKLEIQSNKERNIVAAAHALMANIYSNRV